MRPLPPEVPGPGDGVVLYPALRARAGRNPAALHVESRRRLVELRGRHGRAAGRAASRRPSRAALPAMNVVRLACVPTSHGCTAGVGVDHVDALERHAERLGDDHGEHGLRALADLARPGDRAMTVPKSSSFDDRAAAVRAVDARAAADVEHAGVADAALPAGRRRRRAPRASPAAAASRHSRIAHDVRTKPCGLTSPGFGALQPAQLEPVHAEPVGQVVHLRLDRERGLEVAVAAHRARVGVVRVGDRRVEAHARARGRVRPPSRASRTASSSPTRRRRRCRSSRAQSRASSRPSRSAAVRRRIAHGSRVGHATNSSTRSNSIFTGRRRAAPSSAAMTSIG